jgi:hypothetical protein
MNCREQYIFTVNIYSLFKPHVLRWVQQYVMHTAEEYKTLLGEISDDEEWIELIYTNILRMCCAACAQ